MPRVVAVVENGVRRIVVVDPRLRGLPGAGTGGGGAAESVRIILSTYTIAADAQVTVAPGPASQVVRTIDVPPIACDPATAFFVRIDNEGDTDITFDSLLLEVSGATNFLGQQATDVTVAAGETSVNPLLPSNWDHVGTDLTYDTGTGHIVSAAGGFYGATLIIKVAPAA